MTTRLHTARGLVYDAKAMSRILGLPCKCTDPAPEAAEGEVVIYYGGWTLQQLRLCKAGLKRMWQDQDWYDQYGWKADPGYYHILLPVPGSNRKTNSKQVQHLAGMGLLWQPAPTPIAGSALLAHLTKTGKDLLHNDWCRCLEVLPLDFLAALTVYDGRVDVINYWDDDPYDSVWLSAARKS
jgi:hypothetical protein